MVTSRMLMVLRLSALALAAWFLLASPARAIDTGVTFSSFKVGLKDPWNEVSPELLNETQAQYARFGVSWKTAANDVSGVLLGDTLGLWQWGEADRAFADVKLSGREPLPVLYPGPAKYGGQAFPTTPAALTAFERFAKAFAARYKDRVATYQIWNEQNSPANGGDDQGQEYAAFVRRASTAIRSVDTSSTTKIITGGLSSRSSAEDFTRDFYSEIGSSAPQYIDKYAIHTYEGSASANIAQIERVRAKFPTSQQDQRVIVTEFGWGTTGSSSNTDVQTPAEQELKLRNSYDAFEAERSRLKLSGALWYTWADGPTNRDPAFTDRGWQDDAGLIYYNGSKKPAFGAFKDIAAQIED